MNRLMTLLFLMPLIACSQTKKAQKTSGRQATENSPMACRFEGKIISLLKPDAQDRGNICAEHPCRARVKILNVFGCGSSVSLPLNEGDTVAMRFTYTLDPTAKLFPEMEERLPGLKVGSTFSANATQRLVMGAAGEFVVTAYTRK